MRVIPGLLLLLGVLVTSPVLAWDSGDRQLYNNKMALLRVLLDGAQQRASESGDWQTLCMLMSIGTDVTRRYNQVNPDDIEIEGRLSAMQDDLSVCLTVLYDAQAKTERRSLQAWADSDLRSVRTDQGFHRSGPPRKPQNLPSGIYE